MTRLRRSVTPWPNPCCPKHCCLAQSLQTLQELVEESLRVLGVEHRTVRSQADREVARVFADGHGGLSIGTY